MHHEQNGNWTLKENGVGCFLFFIFFGNMLITKGTTCLWETADETFAHPSCQMSKLYVDVTNTKLHSSICAQNPLQNCIKETSCELGSYMHKGMLIFISLQKVSRKWMV